MNHDFNRRPVTQSYKTSTNNKTRGSDIDVLVYLC